MMPPQRGAEGASVTADLTVGIPDAGWGKPRRRLDYVYPAAVVGGVGVVAAGVLRLLSSGAPPSAVWAAVVLVLVAPILAVFAYGSLRTANAKVWVKGDRIGISNALGVRSAIPITDADFIQLCGMQIREDATPIRSMFIVDKGGRARLRFYGADALTPGGIERLGGASGLALRGSLEETVSAVKLAKDLPGAVSVNMRVSGAVVRHPALVYWGGSAVVFVIGLIGIAVYVVLSHP